jgi:hypothetical protein
MNDAEREQWVDNDEGLYDLMRSFGLSRRAFIRTYRAEIDAVIAAVTDGRKPAHFLKYGG